MVLHFALLTLGGITYDRTKAPPGWVKGARADKDDKTAFTVVLKQRNLEELDRAFWDVSDPKVGRPRISARTHTPSLPR